MLLRFKPAKQFSPFVVERKLQRNLQKKFHAKLDARNFEEQLPEEVKEQLSEKQSSGKILELLSRCEFEKSERNLDFYRNMFFFCAQRAELPDVAVMNLMKCMSLDSVKIDTFIVVTILKALMKVGVEQVVVTFESLKQYIGLDLIVYTALISCLIRVGAIEKGVDYFEEMMSKGIRPDAGFYSAIVTDLVNAGESEKAKAYYSYMREAGFAPGQTLVNRIIPMVCEKGETEFLELIMADVKLFDVELWFPTYTALIESTFTVDLVKSIEYFNEMEEKTQIDNVAIEELLEVLLRKSLDEDSMSFILQKKESLDLRPSEYAYNALIKCSINNGNISAVIQNVEEMILYHITPSMTLYRTMVHELSKKGLMKTVERIVEDMKKIGISPDGVMISDIISGYLKKGDLVSMFENIALLREIDGNFALEIEWDLRKVGILF